MSFPALHTEGKKGKISANLGLDLLRHHNLDLGVFGPLRFLQPLFAKLAKSHISFQFFVRVYVLGWYTYFETPQVLFSLCLQENSENL